MNKTITSNNISFLIKDFDELYDEGWPVTTMYSCLFPIVKGTTQLFVCNECNFNLIQQFLYGEIRYEEYSEYKGKVIQEFDECIVSWLTVFEYI